MIGTGKLSFLFLNQNMMLVLKKSQSAGRSRDEGIVPDAVGSAESLASSHSNTVGLKQGKP